MFFLKLSVLHTFEFPLPYLKVYLPSFLAFSTHTSPTELKSYASAWLTHSCKETRYFKAETKALLSQSSVTGVTLGEWVATKESHPAAQSLGADSETQRLAGRWLNPSQLAGCP